MNVVVSLQNVKMVTTGVTVPRPASARTLGTVVRTMVSAIACLATWGHTAQRVSSSFDSFILLPKILLNHPELRSFKGTRVNVLCPKENNF